jgi:serine-type D-Ala-D-Ala carboxypeptidase/endopeptidase (penicillin-binding protein 4)
MKSIIISIGLLLVLSPGIDAQTGRLAKKNHSVNKLLKEIIADNDFKNADFVFHAIDLKSKEVISSARADKSLIAASNMKLVSTAAVLELYGPDYRFRTVLEYTGKIDTTRHILFGNIIIKGGGDPTLGSGYFELTNNTQFLDMWLAAIQKAGIDSVAGAIIADPMIYGKDIMPLTWSWNNMARSYGAGACGLSIYDNNFEVFFEASDKIGDTAKIVKLKPEIPGLVFNNAVIVDTIRGNYVNIYGAPYANFRILDGKLQPGKKDYKLVASMPDPAIIAASELKRILSENGIGVRDGASTTVLLEEKGIKRGNGSKILIEMDSPVLSDIIRETNTHSINFYAEHCLNHIGLKMSENPQTGSAVKDMLSFWKDKGIDTQGMYLYDGSGLSRHNSFTARQMVGILTYMHDSSQYFQQFYNSLPIGSKTGTLRNMFKETTLGESIRAKSGTVDRAKAYSGYVKSVSGRNIAFSMMVNDFSCTSAEATKKLERLMVALAEFKK